MSHKDFAKRRFSIFVFFQKRILRAYKSANHEMPETDSRYERESVKWAKVEGVQGIGFVAKFLTLHQQNWYC